MLAEPPRMRSYPWFAAVVLVACGSSSEDGREPSSFPDDHAFHNNNSETDDMLYVRQGGRQVPVATLPAVAKRIGLPVTGTADIAISVDVPLVNQATDYTRAVGSAAISCTACQIGDDKSKLNLSSIIGGGIDVSHLTVDRLEAKATVGGGKLELTTWQFSSPDLELDVALRVTFAAASVFDSKVDGCITFNPTKALEARDPKLYSLLGLTGASRGRDGKFHIKLEGPIHNLRRLAQDCGA